MLREPGEPISVARAREIDRLAVERLGLPTIVLMENAAAGLEQAVLERLAGRGHAHGAEHQAAHAAGGPPPGVVRILCGPGQNGGDGLALARRLHGLGVEIEVCLSIDTAACRAKRACRRARSPQPGSPFAHTRRSRPRR